MRKRCEWCGKEFTFPSRVKIDWGRFCSLSCAGKSKRGARNSNWQGGKVERECEMCSEKFEVDPNVVKAGYGRFCSRDCQGAWQTKISLENEAPSKILRRCKWCGKEFTVWPCRLCNGKGKYCSQECSREAHAKAVSTAWARGAYDGVYRSPSSLEIRFAEALEAASIEHVDQYRPEGSPYVYDEYIPGANLLIEIDGEFWHHSEWAHKQGVPERDKRKDKTASRLGYRLLRIREQELEETGACAIVEQKVLALCRGSQDHYEKPGSESQEDVK